MVYIIEKIPLTDFVVFQSRKFCHTFKKQISLYIVNRVINDKMYKSFNDKNDNNYNNK